MTDNSQVKIVIVDDSGVMRSMLRAILSDKGYDVIQEYSSGEGLVNGLGKLSPDIVCLDYNLPGENGLELLAQIHERYSDIAVIIITGDDSLDLDKAAAEAGASGFIRKPFTAGTIATDIHQVALAHQFVTANLLGESLPLHNARANVVVADDSLSMRKLLSAILEQCNINVVAEASNGQQAVELVEKHKPDFVFLDIEMPVMNGITALEQIHAQHPQTKAFMVTSRADRNYVIQAVKTGAKGYILKPYQPAQIVHEIKPYITKQS